MKGSPRAPSRPAPELVEVPPDHHGGQPVRGDGEHQGCGGGRTLSIFPPQEWDWLRIGIRTGLGLGLGLVMLYYEDWIRIGIRTGSEIELGLD